ncbi:MAG: Y-family DNA polymerase [Flavipsychrobacter sp.]
MQKRFVSIWFRHLTTDWLTRRKPALKDVPFVFAAPERGRMVVKAVNPVAAGSGIYVGMVVADSRAILPNVQVFDNQQGKEITLLSALAEWCIRYTPIAAIDPPDGLILDASGCSHLWGGEQQYLKDLVTRLAAFGYHVRPGMADTVGCAWAIARYGRIKLIVDPGGNVEALQHLPPAALRLDAGIIEKLEKLGLADIGSFMNMPRSALRRRFGEALLLRLDQALGQGIEYVQPVKPIEPYQERLPSLEPIRTAPGIIHALQALLDRLCKRLSAEERGLRKAVFKCYRIDGNIESIDIGTARPSRNAAHLFKLFEIKIGQIRPALGIELFILEAPVVEVFSSNQEAIWNFSYNREMEIAELLDRIAVKVGMNTIHRYLPDEHHWPERSYRLATSLQEEATTTWQDELPRPVHLLPNPELIDVTVAMPDYPPMLFKYRGNLHRVQKADGPERIEQEWWIEQGLYRDYYCIEDDKGERYWLFRLGHYQNAEPKWFIHGFFA